MAIANAIIAGNSNSRYGRPACRPDLSPIEHLWDQREERVREPSPENLKQLKTAILEEWDLIPYIVHQQSLRYVD